MRDRTLAAYARANRSKLTDHERILWQRLRNSALGFRFRRQHPIGPYLADFACLNPKLVVEAAGAQHIESDYDQIRDEYLRSRGWTVLRFSNPEILTNIHGVLGTIVAKLDELRNAE